MSSSTQDTDDVVGASDASLLRRIAAGELGALEVLFDRHARSAYALAGRVMADQGFAADAVLDVFVSLWDTPGADGRNLAAWVHEATHRHVVDTLRREQALRTRRTDAVRDAARLRDLPGALGPGQREVLVLAYLGGYTLREVATLTDQPLPTVRQELRVAVRSLVTLLVGPEDSSGDGVPGRAPGDGDHLTEEALAAGWLVHALEPDEEERFAEHLPTCPGCRWSVLRGQGALARLAAALPAQEPVPADLWPTLAARIEASRPPTGPPAVAAGSGAAAGHGNASLQPVGDPPAARTEDRGDGEGRGADDGVVEGVAATERLQRVMVWLGLAMFLALCVAIGVWYVAFRD